MKVLVDTSVWIDHLRRRELGLRFLLELGQVVGHSAVVGELACGTLRERDRFLGDLQQLPSLPEPRSEEARQASPMVRTGTGSANGRSTTRWSRPGSRVAIKGELGVSSDLAFI